MRTAIATGSYYNHRETQINFHVANLFGGNTVVLAQDRRNDDPFGRPVHVWSRAQGTSTLLRLLQKAQSFAAHRTLRVPQGTTRTAIQSFLKAEKVQAILAEFGTAALRIAPVAAETGIPVFAYFRGADASSHLREPFRVAAYWRLMPNLGGVFAVSQFLLDNLARAGIQHPNSHVIPSGVDTGLFVPGTKRAGSFLAVGRFIEKKRPDITIRAFAAVARQRPDITLEMIGDGALLRECRALASAEGVDGCITFHGERSHTFVRDRLAECEVFLQHSITARNGDTEGLPTSIQEAMSAGMAVISTRHAGIADAVIEGETGFLVAERDEAGFAARIGDMLENGDRRAAMGVRAREMAVEHFDNRHLIAKLETQMEKVVGRARLATPRTAV